MRLDIHVRLIEQWLAVRGWTRTRNDWMCPWHLVPGAQYSVNAAVEHEIRRQVTAIDEDT